MAKKRKEPKPPKSNRGRVDARGVLIVFEKPPERDEDAPLAREREPKPK